jgi:hypothetical protein
MATPGLNTVHNSPTPFIKASVLPLWFAALPQIAGAHWVQHSLRWILYYVGWLSVIHLSMQHSWSVAGGLSMAAVWWALLHWHPASLFKPSAALNISMGLVALLGLVWSLGWGQQHANLGSVAMYVLGLSYWVRAIDTPKSHALLKAARWPLVACHALAIAVAIALAPSHSTWLQQWPWLALVLLLGMGLSLTQAPHQSPFHQVCQPSPTMAIMMAFLPLFSLWCATPLISANQHLALHLIFMAAGQIGMLVLLRHVPQATQHPLWGHALCLSATGLVWASNDTFVMLGAMALLAAGSAWLQFGTRLSAWCKGVAILMGMAAIALTANAAHTLGPDALGLGLFFTSLIWTLTHMGLHLRSSYEQRRY